ncbi:MAG TPA: amino acid adenylation domain-containing protein, partial [Candidatus Deferrimicrobium sp.]|nr:amino acid adenylation domain-containing protein [Candidatus Deferrimicrobium sp.]
MIKRHESFRTSFHMINEEPVQRISKVFGPTFFQKGGPPEAIIKSFIRPFDLSQAPLLRVWLVKLAENRHLLLLDMHHIISDGVSTEVLLHDFAALYGGKELPVLGLQYKDYAGWQNREQESEQNLKQESYWLREFDGEIPVLELPVDYARPVVREYEGGSINFEISNEITKLSPASGATVYMVLLAVYTVFLAKISSQEDIVVGTPVAGRGHADLEKIIGLFVNTLALRNYPVGEKTFTGFLREVKEKTLEAFENQDYQYEDLVEQVVLKRDTGRNPLFDTMLVLQNAGPGKIEIPGLRFIPHEYESKISKFDLTLIVVEVEEKLRLTFEYSTKLFKRETVERFSVYFKNIVKSIIENKERKISDFEIITEEEKRLILTDFNDTAAEYPADKTIHQLFAEQVEKTPDRIALSGEPVGQVGLVRPVRLVQLTYLQLNEQSNRLAGLLIQKGVLAGSIVGIMMERSIELIIGLLGVLKSGGAYLPIDPDYPQERIDYMLKDSNAKIMVGNWHACSEIHHSSFIIHHSSHSSHLAYLIYTSGTTGRPKGVLIRHKSFINLIYFHRSIFEENQDSRISQVANPAFDAMGFEVWPCLVSGAALHIADNETRLSPAQMRDWLIRRGITISFQPTVMAEHLLAEMWPHGGVRLKSLCAAGDKLNRYPDRTYPFNLYNLYGPTEDTVWTTWTLVKTGTNPEMPPVIGKPVANHRVYILNSNLKLQPLGMPGELCISGAGLAEGYLNNPELTAEKFNRSYRSYRSYILYKTGDLARWLPDGNIEFLGRIDHQVKIRGFRIELGEIENRLAKHPGIKEAVVLDQAEENGDKYLCAYIVPGGEKVISGLWEYLAKKLPDYMIPSRFISLEKIPLTSNGKIDRGALP